MSAKIRSKIHWLTYEVFHHLFSIYLSSYFMPKPPSQYVFFLEPHTPGHWPFPSTRLALSQEDAFALDVLWPTMPFFSSPSSKFLSRFETSAVKLSWLTYPGSWSLMPLFCHDITHQLFVCMSALVLRQGDSWKLVLIFWCSRKIGKKCK